MKQFTATLTDTTENVVNKSTKYRSPTAFQPADRQLKSKKLCI